MLFRSDEIAILKDVRIQNDTLVLVTKSELCERTHTYMEYSIDDYIYYKNRVGENIRIKIDVPFLT